MRASGLRACRFAPHRELGKLLVDRGYGWPSVAELCAVVKLSKRQLQRVLAQLVQQRAIKVTHRRRGRGHSSEYRIWLADECDVRAEVLRTQTTTSSPRKDDIHASKGVMGDVESVSPMTPDQRPIRRTNKKEPAHTRRPSVLNTHPKANPCASPSPNETRQGRRKSGRREGDEAHH
jgi:hypothetical protein